jgi:hypothetical protein
MTEGLKRARNFMQRAKGVFFGKRGHFLYKWLPLGPVWPQKAMEEMEDGARPLEGLRKYLYGG